VPVGGGGKTVSVAATALLPSSQPAGLAPVTLQTLVSHQVIGTARTDANGLFTVTGTSPGGALEIVVQASPTVMLREVLSQATLDAAPGPQVQADDVTASTTVVAASLELEAAQAPEDEAGIVAGQAPQLSQDQQSQNQSTDDQNQEISDPAYLQSKAKALITTTANAELAGLTAPPGAGPTSVALDGLLAYLTVAQGRSLALTPAQRMQLVQAQVSGTTYSPAALASALRGAGRTTATAAAVQSASQQQRTLFPAFSALGGAVTPLEALTVAANRADSGGFELDQPSLDLYLSQLLPPASGHYSLRP